MRLLPLLLFFPLLAMAADPTFEVISFGVESQTVSCHPDGIGTGPTFGPGPWSEVIEACLPAMCRAKHTVILDTTYGHLWRARGCPAYWQPLAEVPFIEPALIGIHCDWPAPDYDVRVLYGLNIQCSEPAKVK